METEKKPNLDSTWGILIITVVAVMAGGFIWWAMENQPEPTTVVVQSAAKGKIPVQSQNQAQNQTQVEQNIQTVSGNTAPALPAEEKIVYTNSEYGFELTLPKGWEKYKVSAEKREDHAYFYFLLPTTDSSWPGEHNLVTNEIFKNYASMFVIDVWKKSDWDTQKASADCSGIPNPGCPNDAQVIAKTAKYVFEGSGPQAMAKDLTATLNSMGGAVKFIKKGFKLI